MKNTFLNKFRSTIKVNIKGKNINNYLRKLIAAKINILKIINISPQEIEIIISYDDYLKLCKHKGIYKLQVTKTYGKLKLKSILKKNIYLLSSLILVIILIIFLSNVIFEVKVIHSSSSLKNLLYKELYKHDIKKYSMVKSYDQIQKIRKQIINDNKDKIEWLEIKRIGTKYEIRVEERKLNNNKQDESFQSLTTTKNAIIMDIKALSGEKVKEINSYVTPGDIIVSGIITKPDGSKIYTKAKGVIYGEVWYLIDIEYPYYYREERLTGKTKKTLVINLLDKRISLFNFHKFNDFQKSGKTLLKSNILPISLTWEKQYEVNIIEKLYTKNEVVEAAKKIAQEKLLNQNNRIKEVLEIITTEENEGDNVIKLKLFVSVKEDITKIKEETIIQNEQNN